MKILYLCSKDHWDHKMSRVRFHGMDAIGRHPEVELTKSGPGWEGFVNCKQAQDKYNPDLIVWYKPLDMPGYEGVTVPTCLRYNEMWDINWTTNEILKSKSKLIICHHENDINNYGSVNGPVFKHIPHCAEKMVFKDYCIDKNIDIQLIGLLNPAMYPLRSRLKNIVETRMVLKYGTKFRMMPHAGGRVDNVGAQVINYAQQLNRAKINITCSSKYRYALAKYSEVPLCKSLLAADIPRENMNWYAKWMCVIDKDSTDEQIVDLLLLHLEDDVLRENKVLMGYEENRRHRTQENYADQFISISKKFIDKVICG